MSGPSEPDENDENAPAEEEEEDFAVMFEASLQPSTLREGDAVEGTIVAIGSDVAFVDVGSKGEATIDLVELTEPGERGESAEPSVKVGDKVKAVVISTSGGIKLSHKLARQAATREALEDAYRSGLPVEGRVEKAIKGGFEVRFSSQRAFCPISQIDTRYTEDPSIHEGKVYTFRIVEIKRDGKDVVVSRRSLLEEEARERAEEVRKLIVPDAVLPGEVVSVRDYGAFVDLGGGVQGLLHVSEMSWSRVTDPSTIVQPGDEITVQVLRVDEEQGRISLGLKQLQVDPWLAVSATYRVGQVMSGRVVRLVDFGAFIEIATGIEALVHVSTFPPTGKTDGWKTSVAPGAEVAVEILTIDPERKRMGVAVVDEGSVRAESAHARASKRVEIGARLVGKVERHENYGVFVFLKPGKTGLLPVEETGLDHGEDLRRAFPVGSDVEVIVLEIDAERGRIRLSAKAVTEGREKSEAREFAERQDSSQSESFGSLAQTLRDAMQGGDKK